MKSCLKMCPALHTSQCSKEWTYKKGKWYICAYVWYILCLIAEKEGVAFSH